MEDRPWKIVIGGGFALWIVVAGINLAFAATGLYTHFFLGMGVILAVEIAGLALILRATARAGFTYLRQLGAGAVAVLILAVLLFPATLFQWTYIAPDYADVIAELTDGRLRIGLHVQGFGNGGSESFVNNPVPVPAAVWLFGSGLIGLVGVARRKRRN